VDVDGLLDVPRLDPQLPLPHLLVGKRFDSSRSDILIVELVLLVKPSWKQLVGPMAAATWTSKLIQTIGLPDPGGR
jgi:hypothetical protein